MNCNFLLSSFISIGQFQNYVGVFFFEIHSRDCVHLQITRTLLQIKIENNKEFKSRCCNYDDPQFNINSVKSGDLENYVRIISLIMSCMASRAIHGLSGLSIVAGSLTFRTKTKHDYGYVASADLN